MSDAMAPGDMGDKLIVGLTDILADQLLACLPVGWQERTKLLAPCLIWPDLTVVQWQVCLYRKTLQGKDLATGGRGESLAKMGRQEQEMLLR